MFSYRLPILSRTHLQRLSIAHQPHGHVLFHVFMKETLVWNDPCSQMLGNGLFIYLFSCKLSHGD